ncbi:hypothetical protein TNCT_207321 [Trichonephila clavata]|uniref:Uncharacterized protein n=1 Tax=Trichonephila clavata TaxID=2740835 RepID=A0A8X6G3H8_TRICU|nr:hypothetical protein TNCT_207321 [Trichonephila clavata]
MFGSGEKKRIQKFFCNWSQGCLWTFGEALLMWLPWLQLVQLSEESLSGKISVSLRGSRSISRQKSLLSKISLILCQGHKNIQNRLQCLVTVTGRFIKRIELLK